MSAGYLWVEQYRPKNIDEYVFHDASHKAAFTKFIQEKSIPHLLLSGIQGSGKTTISQILISSLGIDESDVLTINASDERGIDTFRDTIKNFCSSMPMSEFKIVHLEESDQLTPQAQAALKRFMEEVHDTCRFILTCNHENKIIAPIKSRCQHFKFKSGNRDDIAEYLVTILAAESVKFNLDVLYKYIDYGYPDIRKIVNTVQQHSINNILSPTMGQDDTSTSGDYRFQLLELLSENKWHTARQLLCTSVTNDEWENVYRFLYDNIHTVPKFAKYNDKWETAIVTIAEYLYKNTIVADQEINMSACLIQLSHI